MPLKCFLFLLLIVAESNAKSQTLLNADSSEIKRKIGLKDGRMRKSFNEKNIEMNGYYKKIVFGYPIPPEGNMSLVTTTFCLTLKNKCFKYYEEYWGRSLVYEKIDDLKKYYPKLKQVKEQLTWIDNDNGFEINLIPKRIGAAYVLEIKNIR